MNKSIKVYITLIVLFFACSFSYAQISPPGLGKAKTASWMAIGLKQKLDSLNKKSALTYLGYGTVSDPEGDNNPFKKSAIFVLNHERYNHFSKHWQYSYALSYRRSNAYSDVQPFYKEGTEQEFRLYGRMSYILSNSKLKWTNTLRQEFRKYFEPDFSKADENLQLRTRLKSQLAYDLGSYDQKFILSAEALFATSLMNVPTSKWSSYQYKESRFAFYYSRKLPKTPITMDLGYMNNLIHTSSKPVDVHYLALDLIWNLPYHKKY